MKSKLRYYLLSALFLSVFTSCDDLINIDPVSEIPASEMWQSTREVKAGVNQLYSLFRTTMRRNYYYWGEFRSDNFIEGSSLDRKSVV